MALRASFFLLGNQLGKAGIALTDEQLVNAYLKHVEPLAYHAENFLQGQYPAVTEKVFGDTLYKLQNIDGKS